MRLRLREVSLLLEKSWERTQNNILARDRNMQSFECLDQYIVFLVPGSTETGTTMTRMRGAKKKKKTA